MGAEGEDVGQEIQIPFLDIGAAGTAATPVEVLFEKLIGLAEVDAVNPVTAMHLGTQLFEPQPPVADFMIGSPKGWGGRPVCP